MHISSQPNQRRRSNCGDKGPVTVKSSQIKNSKLPSYHRKNVYKTSNQSEEGRRWSYEEKNSDERTTGKTDGWTDSGRNYAYANGFCCCCIVVLSTVNI